MAQRPSPAPSPAPRPDPRPAGPAGRVLHALCRGLAVLGGCVLCAIAAMTTVSVASRWLAGRPIPGDFELIAVGTGVGIFAFLPYCQVVRANVVVDFFLDQAPARVKSAFDALGYLLYGLIVALLAWRTTVGGIDIYRNEETTMLLELPYWTLFPFAVLCLVLLCVACGYTLALALKEIRSGQRPGPGAG